MPSGRAGEQEPSPFHCIQLRSLPAGNHLETSLYNTGSPFLELTPPQPAPCFCSEDWAEQEGRPCELHLHLTSIKGRSRIISGSSPARRPGEGLPSVLIAAAATSLAVLAPICPSWLLGQPALPRLQTHDTHLPPTHPIAATLPPCSAVQCSAAWQQDVYALC